jgi:hypothetical protein
MKKIIRLTESDLLRIIKKVIKEQESQNNIFDQFKYYFEKEGYNPNENTEKEIFIDISTQEVFIDNNEGKLKKLPHKIPYKKYIGFDEENKPNQSLMDANRLHKITDNTTSVISNNVSYYKDKGFPIKIVFIDDNDNDNDNIPKKGYITLPSENGKPEIKTNKEAKKV